MSTAPVERPSPDRTVYRLAGLTCADCAARFERKLKEYPGVIDATVNFGAAKVTITGTPPPVEVINELGAFDNIRVDEGALGRAVPGGVADATSESPAGAPAGAAPGAEQPPWWAAPTTVLTGLSGVLIAVAFGLQWLTGRGVAGQGVAAAPESLIVGLYLLATLAGGWRAGRQGLRNLTRLEFDMNTLMTVAVMGAVGIGYWEEAAVVAFLFGVSDTLSEYSIERARRSLRSLLELAPREAQIVRDGREQTVPVEDVQVGDLLLVRPGEKIAMDGVVESGSSSVNEAAITGEAIPVAKEAGAQVFAGSINGEGALRVRVSKLAQDTTLAKIIEMVEEAQEQRAPMKAFVDRFARYYTPAVMAAAVLITVMPPLLLAAPWQPWLYRGLSLLIIACPCALVVSTPVAIVTAIGNAARNGVLIKGGVHLENLGSIRAIAFDKTGTLTEGRPRVTDIDVLAGAGLGDERQALGSGDDLQGLEPGDGGDGTASGASPAARLAVLAGIESRSEHPLAAAIVTALADRNINPAEVDDFRALPGKGAHALYRGQRYYAGNVRLFEELGVNLDQARPLLDQRHGEGKTTVLFGTPSEVLAVVALADHVRDSSRWAIDRLGEAGVTRTIMLSGDNEATARAVAQQVGLAEYRAELLPEDKVAYVKALVEQHQRVAMVGDGVNDAPALATATTGIAMGGAGSDTAIETADIVLMGDDLTKLPYAVRLSRKTLAVIKQNIAFSLIIKALAVLLVFPGWLTLWLAVLSDTGATVLVVLNSLRLLRVGER